MFLRSLLMIPLLFLVVPAFAGAQENPVAQIETCRLEGELNLTTNTQIICDGDLVVAESAHITVADGCELQIFVHGTVFYPQSGFGVEALGDSSLLVSALTASGLLQVDGGDISLEYASYQNYDQELRP